MKNRCISLEGITEMIALRSSIIKESVVRMIRHRSYNTTENSLDIYSHFDLCFPHHLVFQYIYHRCSLHSHRSILRLAFTYSLFLRYDHTMISNMINTYVIVTLNNDIEWSILLPHFYYFYPYVFLFFVLTLV